MDNIENTYTNYETIFKDFPEEEVRLRIEQVYSEMVAFLDNFGLSDIAFVNRVALDHAILDYYSDIKRLKDYQHIKRVNEIKIKAYETFWLLKRKPIQLKGQLEDDKFLYVNEKFLLERLTSFMLDERVFEPFAAEKGKAFMNFLDTLYYYMKFRRCDPQSFELMLLAFQAGKLL